MPDGHRLLGGFMRKILSGITMTLAAATAAQADPLQYTAIVSGGSYGSSLAPLNDGVIPADGTAYNTAAEVHDYDSSTVFSLDFGQAVTISDILATVDNNDDYTFAFFDFSPSGNGSVLPKLVLTIPASAGNVQGGVQTFASFTSANATTLSELQFSPVVATTVNVYSANGDGLYGIGEVQFFSSSAVPETASWVMLVGGFGLIGAALRRRRATAHFA